MHQPPRQAQQETSENLLLGTPRVQREPNRFRPSSVRNSNHELVRLARAQGLSLTGPDGLTGVDEIVLSVYAKGMTTGKTSAHNAVIYGASVSKETVSRITDKVMEETTEWANRKHRPGHCRMSTFCPDKVSNLGDRVRRR